MSSNRQLKSNEEILKSELETFKEVLRQKDEIININKVETTRLITENEFLRQSIIALREQNKLLVDRLQEQSKVILDLQGKGRPVSPMKASPRPVSPQKMPVDPQREETPGAENKSDILGLTPAEIINLFSKDESPGAQIDRKRSLSVQEKREGKQSDRSTSAAKKSSEDKLELQLKQLVAEDPKPSPAPASPLPDLHLQKELSSTDTPYRFVRLSSIIDPKNAESIGLNKSYEDMYIFGCDKSKISDFAVDNELEISTLFSLYSPNDEATRQTLLRLSKFVLPFGRKFRIAKVKNLFPKVQEALFTSKGPFDFSFFSLHGDESSGFKLTKKQEEFVAKHFGFDILKDTNPNRFYYYYCVRVEDYFVPPPKEGARADLVELYFYPKAFIIKTLYPLTRLFQDFLTDAMFELRQRRLAQFQQAKEGARVNVERLAASDGQAVLESEVAFMVEAISQLDQLTVTNNYNEKFAFSIFPKTPFTYTLPTSDLTPYCECETSFDYVFRTFPFDEFLFIFFSILNEKTVVFVSENLFAISSCISTFLALIRPLKWEFPVVYSLPDDCLLLLGSPIPILVGLNLPSFHVVNDILPEFKNVTVSSSSNSVYVFLDEGLYFYDFERYDEIVLPSAGDWVERLEKVYQKSFNPKASAHFRTRKVVKNKSSVNVLKATNPTRMRDEISKLESTMIDWTTQRQVSDKLIDCLAGKRSNDYSVFWSVYQMMNSLIFSKLRNASPNALPKSADLSAGDVSFFGVSHAGDVEFLQRLFKTQTFNYYLDSEIFGIRYGS